MDRALLGIVKECCVDVVNFVARSAGIQVFEGKPEKKATELKLKFQLVELSDVGCPPL